MYNIELNLVLLAQIKLALPEEKIGLKFHLPAQHPGHYRPHHPSILILVLMNSDKSLLYFACPRLVPASFHDSLIRLAVVGMGMGVDYQADILGFKAISFHGVEQVVQTALIKLIDLMSWIYENMGSIAAKDMGKKIAV